MTGKGGTPPTKNAYSGNIFTYLTLSDMDPNFCSRAAVMFKPGQ